MDSVDISERERRARRKYEWARLSHAFIGFVPALLPIAVAVALSKHQGLSLGAGLALFVLGIVLLWYGRDLRRAVLPGILLGLLPLALALCANQLGHVCAGDACWMWCVPACTIGGLGAGLGVGLIGARHPHAFSYWLAASSIAVLTGAMGCSCMGYTGIAGLVSGYLVGLAAAQGRRLFKKMSS